MRAPALCPISNSSTIIHRTIVLTANGNTDGSEETGRSRSGSFRGCPTSRESGFGNPISDISRWKIFDNLRRSLVDPFLLLLFVAGWLGLPGGPLYWTIVSLVLLFFPTIFQIGIGIVRAIATLRFKQIGSAILSSRNSANLAFLHLVFLG